MSVYKDKNGTWYVMTRCDDWQGQRKQKCKRGFKTKREAQDWERRFLLQHRAATSICCSRTSTSCMSRI